MDLTDQHALPESVIFHHWVAMKELGQMWQVDYRDLDNLAIKQVNSAKFLHDGFFDPTGRYFQIAANASNKMVIVDSETGKLEAMLDVGVSGALAFLQLAEVPFVGGA